MARRRQRGGRGQGGKGGHESKMRLLEDNGRAMGASSCTYRLCRLGYGEGGGKEGVGVKKKKEEKKDTNETRGRGVSMWGRGEVLERDV